VSLVLLDPSAKRFAVWSYRLIVTATGATRL